MKRWKNSSFGLCADPDGVWVRYEDHVEAMKRIAGDSLLAASESLAAPKARCHPAIECCGKEPCELATPPCASVVRKTFEFYAVTKQQPEPVALHQWRYFGNAAWLDASAEEIATRKASNVATDMEFRIVYAAPAPSASPAALIYQEMDPSGTWEVITKERYDDMIALGESRLARVIASPDDLTGENDAEQVRPEVDAMARQQSVQGDSADSGAGAGRDSVLVDDFRGDTTHLVSCIKALIRMSDAGAIVPHGIGGHARALLSAAAVRLAASPADQVEDARDA